MALVPPGPLSAHFEVLRDGEDEAELERATEALAAAAHARPLVEEARQRSLDLRYRLRLHRVLLRSGDEAARRAAVEAALKDDQGLFLALDVLEAWRLDPEGFRDALRGIPRTRGKLGARALADALAGAPLPRGQESAAALKALHRDAPPALRAWLAPCLLLAGRAEAFEETANLLSTAEPPLADLARRALHDASAGLGPPRDADAADWQRWCGEYARARAVLVRACLPFLDGEEVDPAAVAAAKREAIEEKERVLRAVPVFLREPDSYHEEVARVLGDIIARAAGPDDEEAVVAILRSLDSRRGGLRGHEIIGGALLALDRAVVAEAVEALVRIGPAVDRWQPPLLVQPARDADVEPLATYVQGLHERLAAQGRRALACFRTRHTAERVLDASLGRAERIELGALLASPQVEAELLRRFREGDKESLRILEQIGSEKTLSELIKDFNRRPDGTIGLALQRLGTPDLLPKLRRGFDGLQSAAQAGSIFRALELIGGKQAAQLALRRLEDGDRLRGLALKTLVRLGHPKAREPALEPFRRWEERGRKDPRPGRREVQALARCGKQEDGRLLMQLIEHYGASFPATADAIWGMARLGYREVVPELYGYVHTTNRFRGIAAVSLAVLGAKELPARVEALLASASGRRDLHDMVLLAAAAYVDPPRARAAAEPFLAGAREQPEAAACLAYVCALAQDGAALEALAASPREQVRAAVARGIAWAAASSDRGFAPPACLSTLRVDRALSVRLEAAVAAGYARAEGAVRDIGLALATAPAELLDEKRGGPRLLQLLADTEGDSSPRAALWNAYADLRDDPTLRFREGLGRGRLVAAELRVRAAR
ncbi:MAG: hypothetical protein D6731_09390 [Planctomycetota bacterium]|nr:MAG: hypothetical protein D6731_09390 [Planctomycetota bacterium]